MIGVLIAIYLGSGVFVVQDGQAGVVIAVRQYRYTAAHGIHWRLLYPFQTHELVNTSARFARWSRPQQRRSRLANVSGRVAC